MPYFDATGPLGCGPMTGMGYGFCGGGYGLGFGRGGRRGRGRGLGFGYGPMYYSKKDAKQDLDDYKKSLEEELEAVKAQLKDIDQEK